MSDRLTFEWAVIAAILTTALGPVVNYTVDARWLAQVAMPAAMVGLTSFGRIRHKRRARRATRMGSEEQE